MEDHGSGTIEIEDEVDSIKSGSTSQAVNY